MAAQTGRPAHRPSRRDAIVRAALDLVAEGSPETVTIADIAAAAKMTATAVYYHYPTREAILLEGFQAVGQTYRASVRVGVQRVVDGESIRAVPSELMDWATKSPGARAYFLCASGLSSSVEATLRQDRIYAVEQLRGLVKQSRPDLRAAEVSMLAVALLSLIETSLASLLTMDRARKGLSLRRFYDAAESLVERMFQDA